MSTFNDIDVECPQCGEEFRGTVWVAIHAGQDPELKDLLLGGELNLISCPECGLISFQEQFLIYQEPAAELVAYVYPDAERGQEAELRKLMLSGFQQAQETLPKKERLSYDPVLVFGLEELIEMLRDEESLAHQSQIAQQLCKQNNLNFELLRPAQARRMHSVRVLPRIGSQHPPTRADVVAGIEQLLAINPALDVYATLLESIKADPAWSL
jgi:hypothetical protein